MDTYVPSVRGGLPEEPEYFLTANVDEVTIHYPRILKLIDPNKPARLIKTKWLFGGVDVENVRVW
ncbi:hypothetical protein H1S01_03940 [Heliobacterium chlorum]|uniref:Uncharacterized protein n=1 Tax=Heliobacterium chlorum TaxID=2698 RepID=A0ABR7T2A0_HELCL|nr:hypothetical protein [Heliobacterium chlorum]MBC9783666.1 hypothetical protein [Heliobacterium chlorum]